MDWESLDNRLEQGILGLVLGMLCYAPLAIGGVRPFDQVVLQALMAVTLLAWILRVWIQDKPRILMVPTVWGVLLFLAYAGFQYAVADVEYAARNEVLRVLLYAFLFLAVLNHLYSQESIRILSVVVVFAGMLVALYGLFQFLAESNRVWAYIRPAQYEGRASGTFINPNHFAGFLEMLLPVGLALCLKSRLPHLMKVFLAYASLIMLAGIIVSLSRMAWITTGVVLFIFFGVQLWKGRHRWILIVFLVLIAAGATLFVARNITIQKRFNLADFYPNQFENIRFRIWRPAFEIWQEHPWLGVGPNHFDFHYGKYRSIHVQARPRRVHNDYLNLLVDWGVAGAGIALLTLGLLTYGVVRSWRYVKPASSDLGGKGSNKFALTMGACTGCGALLFHTIADFHFHVPANALLFVVLCALLASQLRHRKEGRWNSLGWPMRTLLTLVLGSVLVVMVWTGWRSAAENYWLAKAQSYQGESVAKRLDALLRAYQKEPMNPDTAYTIGEIYRVRSWQGLEGYEELAREAMRWFERVMELNPYDPYARARYGMCLDWLGQHEVAEPYFQRARELDPNNYFILALSGWHEFQEEDYPEAMHWFERSLYIKPGNEIAAAYLKYARRALQNSSQP